MFGWGFPLISTELLSWEISIELWVFSGETETSLASFRAREMMNGTKKASGRCEVVESRSCCVWTDTIQSASE